MTDVHAGIGLGQMKRYDSMLNQRKIMIERLDRAFCDIGAEPVKHYTEEWQVVRASLCPASLRGQAAIEPEIRNDFIVRMAQLGVAANVHYKPLPMHTGYQALGFDIRDYPNAYGAVQE